MTDAARGPSIERRLPLLMAAVLFAVLATSLVLTYRTLASAAQATASERLGQVAHTVATMVEQSTRVRNALFGRTARDPDLLRVLRGAPEADRPLAESILKRLELPIDSGLPITLWTAEGRRVAGIGVGVDAVARPELPAGAAPPPATARNGEPVITGAPYVDAGRVFYNIIVPVDDGAERLGYIVMLRRIGNNRGVATQIRALTGEAATLYLHQPGQPVWASLSGAPATEPTPVDSGIVARRGVGDILTTAAPIGGTPWVLSLEESLGVVLARPRETVRALALVSFALTMAGAIASWLIGRHIARPLGQLSVAAEAIARGDFRAHVPDHGQDEVGRLARSFNAMASDVDRAMRATEEARDAAEEANRAKSDFLAVMSHELRTPLNAIGGYTELMELGIYGPVNDEQRHALGRVTRSQQHLLGLIDNVLNFARLGAAKVHYEIRDVAVRQSIAAVEPMIAPQLAAKDLRYTCAVPDTALTVRADDDKLHQILLNLLSNAVKFTPEGGVVAVESAADDTTVRFIVRDTGVGIPPDRLRHIFEPFVQVDRTLTRSHDGVGLGLAISHDLALGMNGTLTAESTPGSGSAFTLVLPRG